MAEKSELAKLFTKVTGITADYDEIKSKYAELNKSDEFKARVKFWIPDGRIFDSEDRLGRLKDALKILADLGIEASELSTVEVNYDDEDTTGGSSSESSSF